MHASDVRVPFFFLQIEYTVMFSLANSLISDALGGGLETEGAVLAPDPAFRRSFHDLVR